jgi:hypothetical protein
VELQSSNNKCFKLTSNIYTIGFTSCPEEKELITVLLVDADFFLTKYVLINNRLEKEYYSIARPRFYFLLGQNLLFWLKSSVFLPVKVNC